jgi:hypothetical protein
MAEFLHPSVTSRIIDNSVVYVTAQGLTMLYAAFPAAQGPDNKIQLITSESEFLFYYGAPNMRKYGQTAYNVVNWLRAGGVALCLRILPYIEKDAADHPLQQATYACYILEVGCKDNSAIQVWSAGAVVAKDEVRRVGQILYVAEAAGTAGSTAPSHIGGSASDGGVNWRYAGGKELKTRVRALGDGRGAIPASVELAVRDDASIAKIVLSQPDDVETDGFKYHPILALRGRDRGERYNSFGVSIDLSTTQDETYAHRLYQLSIFSSASKMEESFLVSLHPEATDLSGLSQHVVDVLMNYSNTVRAVYSEDGYDAVCAYMNDDPVVARKLDVLTCRERSVSVAETLHASVTAATGSTDLSPTPEVFRSLGGGTDGDWEGPNSLESLLYKAYSGSGDFVDEATGANKYDTHFSDAWDKKAYPIDMVLDANYPQSVKVAISNFSRTRGDFLSILDVGFTGSPGQALRYRQDQLTLNTFFSAIFVQDFVVTDEFQGSEIRVTPTYYLAEKIPTVDSEFGIHWTFAGPRRGAIAGFKSMSWNPNDPYKEQLYIAKLNYVEKDTRATRFMSQSTSQFVNSALSDISHVRTLLRIRRKLEEIGEQFQFEFNDSSTWGQMEYSVNSYLQEWVNNRALATAKGIVYASEYDRQQRIVRVKAEVTFTGLIERVLIDIVVNR